MFKVLINILNFGFRLSKTWFYFVLSDFLKVNTKNLNYGPSFISNFDIMRNCEQIWLMHATAICSHGESKNLDVSHRPFSKTLVKLLYMG